MNVGQFLILILKGALIGAGAILPGISGGVLCVTLGLYKMIIYLLANPIRAIKKAWKMYIPIGIGFALGVLGLSKVVDLLFTQSETPAIWLFIGLIAGSIPDMFRDAGEKGRGAKSYIGLAVGFAVSLAFFLLVRGQVGEGVTPNTAWWLVCGGLWGVGIVVPGLSPSSIFIFLGLYQPMSAGIASLSMPILIPMGIGLVVSALLLGRVMKVLLKKWYSVAMHTLTGFAVASTIAIIPNCAGATTGDVFLYVGCFLIGAAIALAMGYAQRILTGLVDKQEEL